MERECSFFLLEENLFGVSNVSLSSACLTSVSQSFLRHCFCGNLLFKTKVSSSDEAVQLVFVLSDGERLLSGRIGSRGKEILFALDDGKSRTCLTFMPSGRSQVIGCKVLH